MWNIGHDFLKKDSIMGDAAQECIELKVAMVANYTIMMGCRIVNKTLLFINLF
jgi:hypothetical protein